MLASRKPQQRRGFSSSPVVSKEAGVNAGSLDAWRCNAALHVAALSLLAAAIHLWYAGILRGVVGLRDFLPGRYCRPGTVYALALMR